MNVWRELPEQLPMEKRRTYIIPLIVLLASLLIFTLVFAYPLFTGLPSQQLTSSDWAGYSVASDLNNPQPQVTSVSGSWTVPAVTVSLGDSFCAMWIGVGGQFDETLIQAGTEQDSLNGLASYSAWYELLPYDAVEIDTLNISPGDKITTAISLLNSTTNTWSIEIHDVTNGQSFQKNLVYDSSMLSAEWIVERPTVDNRISTLADFGQVTFTDCKATISNTVGAIKDFPSVQIIMYNRQNTELAGVSPFSPDGSSFTVNYLD